MIPNNILRVSLWVVCMFSLITNVIVIAGRIKSKIPAIRNKFRTTVGESQNTFLINLAIADYLTGVYLCAIGIADAAFGKDYFLSAFGWRSGNACKGIGFIGFSANVASMLILTFVSVERFCTIVFPFGKDLFRSKLTAIICVAIWVTSGAMAIAPIILSEFVTELFGFSDVCLGLPINSVPEMSNFQISEVPLGAPEAGLVATRKDADIKSLKWIYSQIVYIYFSATCVSIITFCYISIFISAIRSKIQSGRPGSNKDEIKMAFRIFIIVGTDLLCWLPVITTGILSTTGYKISANAYAWFAIFVLPINSAFNPLIYTLPAIKKRKENEPSFIAK
ncbi:hypothetical protein HOLleu_26329 [Holothuria leucospilota]|uniref:G-protein coupled receptors family 1 profile domain-containing protein n=1 Tax=Holothuria leucospilota TaxID=206669 RepID=A0A9Q1H549_HOLLE|nr:hypothetical protein HOLleu_26329 [Holothuria leucospilota]